MTPSHHRVDPRGQRFAASVTALVLAVALLASPGALTLTLVAAQLAVFAVGAYAGPGATPYALAFRRLVRPRLGPPAELEDPAPPRFAQGVGLVFATVSLAGYVAGLDLLGALAAGLALGAAFLNAAFGFCLGCELFLFAKRFTTRDVADVSTTEPQQFTIGKAHA